MIKEIKINNSTKKVVMKKEDRFLGVKGENKYETLKFIFEEDFLDGEGILEIQKPNSQKEYIILEKEEDCYLLEVKNSLLNFEGEITMQLVVRQENNVVFKSVEFTMQVLKAIEATTEIPDEYETWDSALAAKILEIDSKLEEVTSLEEDLEDKVESGYFKGDKGDAGEPGQNGTDGLNGTDGKSAYEIWLDEGNQGTEQDFLNSIKGADGRNGTDGQNGRDGINGVDGKDGKDGSNGLDGKSAYQIWLDEGNVGTEQNFLDSLKGVDGQDGIDGKNGKDGMNGQDGYTPIKGTDYWTTSDKAEIVQDTIQDLQPTLNSNLQTAKDYTDNQIARDFKNISYDNTTATFVFTRHDNTTFTVDLPLEQTVKNGYYDDTTEELVLVLVSNQEIRIPASGLIDDYSGQTSATIQVSISADNKITCNIVSGSISKTLLTSELQTEINNKANRSELPSKTSQLTNDSNFATITYVDNLFNSIVDGDEVSY